MLSCTTHKLLSEIPRDLGLLEISYTISPHIGTLLPKEKPGCKIEHIFWMHFGMVVWRWSYLPYSCSEWLRNGDSVDGQVTIEVETDADVVEHNSNRMVEQVCHFTLQRRDCRYHGRYFCGDVMMRSKVSNDSTDHVPLTDHTLWEKSQQIPQISLDNLFKWLMIVCTRTLCDWDEPRAGWTRSSAQSFK